MYIVGKIGIITLVSQFLLAKAGSGFLKETFTGTTNFPSRLYLPTSQNPEPKNRARTTDIEAILENDLQVIPLAADHDQRNGFQYQPIISRQYSRVFTESPRYSQSAVPNLTQSKNTHGLGSPISNANEVKPIIESQSYLNGLVACSSKQRENDNPTDEVTSLRGSNSCLRRFQSQSKKLTPSTDQIPGHSLRRKILTVNDQESNIQLDRLPLQLTPPLPPRDGISRISRHRIDKVSLSVARSSAAKLVAPGGSVWSKKTILIGQPAPYNDDGDVKPVFESNEYGTNYDNYNNPDHYNVGDYQLENYNTTASISGSVNGPFKQYVTSTNAGEVTCRDILQQFLLQAHQGYNYGYNTQQHVPTNPILALLLSHYGKYLPGFRKPRVYSYMAVNNIHNNKPFGNYKLTGDDDASSVQ